MIKKFRSAVSNPTLLKEFKSRSPGIRISTSRDLKHTKTLSSKFISKSKSNSPRVISPQNGLASYTTAAPSIVTGTRSPDDRGMS